MKLFYKSIYSNLRVLSSTHEIIIHTFVAERSKQTSPKR